MLESLYILLGLGAIWYILYWSIRNDKARSIEEQTGWLRMAWLPTFRAVREDPRFFEAARTIGMVELWEARGYPDGCIGATDASGDHLDCSGGDE